MLLIFGVLLPAITLGFELWTGASAEIYVDPIPTWWHILLVASVPVLNAFCISAIRNGTTKRRSTLFLLNGLAMGISGVYALIYLPISIAGVFGILAFGFGFLPLSPLLSFIAAIYLCSYLSELPPNTLPHTRTLRPTHAIAVSLATGILCVVIPEIQPWMTEQAVQMALKGDMETRQQGISLLRSYSDERELATQLRTSRTSSLARRVNWVDRNEANELFFRVTGKQLNRVSTRRPRDVIRFDAFDENLGGEIVGKRVDGLSMKSSRIDAEIDADTSVTYTEWTMVFQNDAFIDNEARAQILLPPGGVVSRLTLWVNGEPREAAFSSTGKVRSAYQEVAVRQRRDPVLVTWKGKDRVLLQCFPVPSRGGTMKLRVGVTAPLGWESGYGSFELPRIIEHNFESNVRHAVWIESDSELQTNIDRLVEKERENLFATSGQLTSNELAAKFQVLRKPIEETFEIESGRDTLQGSIESRRVGQPRHLVFVVDGSHVVQAEFENIAAFLGEVGATSKVDVLLASEEVVDLSDVVHQPDELKAKFDANKRRGGFDSIAALVEAWDRAGEDTDVVWIHGLQPLGIDDHDTFRQRIEKDFVAPTLWDLQIGSGPNRIMEGVQEQLNVERISRSGTMIEDLRTWWSGLEEPTWQVVWKSIGENSSSHAENADSANGSSVESNVSTEVDGEVVSRVVTHKQPKAVDLWAFDRVRNLLRESRNAENRFALRKEATQLAAASHLVTPVSGAVVLETQEQYDRAGLVPEDKKHVMTTPEPSSRLLMLLTLLPVFHLGRKRRS